MPLFLPHFAASYQIISYKEDGKGDLGLVSTAGIAASLARALESPSHALSPGGLPLSCFYDRTCLEDGDERHGQSAFLHGLVGANLVVLLVSRDVIEGFKLAHKRRDTTLHQWEVTLERVRAGECLCLPVLVGRVSIGADDLPASPHFASGISIRDTVIPILTLPVVALSDDFGADGLPSAEDLDRVGETVAGMLRSYTFQKRCHGDELLRLDRYLEREWGRLKRLIDHGDIVGRGGFSTVYRGVLGGHDGEVAVKAFSVSTAAAHSMKQFNEEAEIMLRLDHPVSFA